jgi:hypothetical protein
VVVDEVDGQLAVGALVRGLVVVARVGRDARVEAEGDEQDQPEQDDVDAAQSRRG